MFEDCGLGKTIQLLVWSEEVSKYTKKKVLILSPLAIVEQTKQEEAAYKEYLSYKPCMTCGEQWKNGGSSQPTHSSSQRRILEENNLASQSVNSGRRFVQGLVAVIVAGTLATITYSLLTKSNNSVNEAFR